MASPIFPHLAKPVKLIVLDRDGVINEDSDAYVKSPNEWIPIPGSLQAIARLCKAGWTVAVATNQSGLARGKFDAITLEDMHFKMQQLVMEQGGRIDLIVHCPHGPDDGCECRKPRPGLFRTIAEHFSLADLQGVPVVGDSYRDLHAGMHLGGRPYLVRTGKGMRTLEGTLPPGTQVFDDLAAVVDHLLGSTA
nr:D-glycero-beta-D-manno-heptose 1,7-bisphosphate 7-phosphatase [Stutzerimonas stutzeri]